MTTLCYKDGILATDSRMTNGRVITSDSTRKIWDLRDKEIYYLGDKILAIALGGQISHFDYYLAYLMHNDFPNPDFDKHEVIGILVGSRHLYELEAEASHLIQYSLTEYISSGSGNHYARSAMALGKSAKQAVEHAKRFDTCSGGPVQWLKL